MNKKSVIAANTVISLAILAIGLIVLFHVVFPEVKDVIVGEGEKGACEWSLVMHSITKLGDWSLIPAECRAHRIEIDMDYLSDYHKEAKNRIKTYINNKDKYAEILHFFNNPNDELQLNEWALNRIIAKETKDCWEKVFKGKLPLFESGWWNLISWDALGVSEAPKKHDVALTLWANIL
ncbi:hypothetical protein KY314_02300, partial [Candidatus Woesearchaeota archaeon]|nr:hypothetical protein [Candidatus Woesearchaeota archaeon]